MDPRIEEAKKILKTADHMICVAYPVLKDEKLLMKAFDGIGKAISLMIDSALQKEYGRIITHLDSKSDFERFTKISKSYGITHKEINELYNILSLIERRRKSPMNFSRKGKFIIMHENLHTESVNISDLKSHVNTAKELLKKIVSSRDFH